MQAIQTFDIQTLFFIQDYLRSDFMTGFWSLITTLGKSGLFWLATALLLFCRRQTRLCGLVAFFSIGIGATLTNLFLKHLVARPRPFDTFPDLIPLFGHPTDFSFPSGHTTAAFACAFVLYAMLPKRYGVPALVTASLIAFSRLYLGLHYPTDILGGVIVAFLSSHLALYAAGRWQQAHPALPAHTVVVRVDTKDQYL